MERYTLNDEVRKFENIVSEEFLFENEFKKVVSKDDDVSYAYNLLDGGYVMLTLIEPNVGYKMVVNNEPYIYAGVVYFAFEMENALACCGLKL